MSVYGDKIQRITNRNKKYIINYKVDKVIRLGQNIYEIRMTDDLLDEDE